MKQENQLTLNQMKAAAKVAADILTNKEIAASLSISERTLDRWKHLPAFQAQLKALRDAHNQHVRKRYVVDMSGFL
jgi:FixJ family two-component response regulator